VNSRDQAQRRRTRRRLCYVLLGIMLVGGSIGGFVCLSLLRSRSVVSVPDLRDILSKARFPNNISFDMEVSGGATGTTMMQRNKVHLLDPRHYRMTSTSIHLVSSPSGKASWEPYSATFVGADGAAFWSERASIDAKSGELAWSTRLLPLSKELEFRFPGPAGPEFLLRMLAVFDASFRGPGTYEGRKTYSFQGSAKREYEASNEMLARHFGSVDVVVDAEWGIIRSLAIYKRKDLTGETTLTWQVTHVTKGNALEECSVPYDENERIAERILMKALASSPP